MRQKSPQRPLRQRAIALAAAYAIALSSLVASYGLANAAGTAVAVPGTVICHGMVDADQGPAPTSNQADHCADNCCVGCIMLLAALPLPSAEPAGVLPSSVQRLSPLAGGTLAVRPETASRRSRGPPSKA